jgi:hypothetical protein
MGLIKEGFFANECAPRASEIMGKTKKETRTRIVR